MSALGLRRRSKGLGLSPRRRAAPRGSEPPGDTEAPSVPQNLSATAVSDDQIDLTWDPSTDNVGVTGYRIYRDNVLVDASPTNAYADTELDPGTEYEYEVSAFDAANNESARSAADSATTHQVIVTDGLVAEWRFDNGWGEVLTDYAGGHHGQLGSTAGSDANDPSWATGGLSFAGSHGGGANDYVITSPWTFPSPDFHVDIVGKFTGSAPPGVDFFFVAGRNTGTGADDNTSPLTVFRDGTNASLHFRVGNGITSVDTVSSPGAVGTCFDGGWHHMAIDYDGADMTVHLDGAQILAKTFGLTPNSATQPSLFGIFFDLSSIPFTGILGYITVYNRTFSAAERSQQETALAEIMATRGVALP
jgi:hypothetical protein